MTLEHLCNLLEIPTEVKAEILSYKNSQKTVITDELLCRLTERSHWDGAIHEIQEKIGDDPCGFYILSELLDCACITYKRYEKMGIDTSIFIQTMKFCTRFLLEHKKIHGCYSFTWAWWFPRQLALQEFRIGALEYEFIENQTKQISIHIPSDACITPKNIHASFLEYKSFLHTHFPEWENAPWHCESWMLSPALKQLLPQTSNILYFQSLFEVESVDYESMAVLDWVYPGEKGALKELSENTSLQRNMKQFFLDGKRVGWAKGKVR